MNIQWIRQLNKRIFSGSYRSIRTKLLFCFLIVTLIPLLSLGALSYYQSAKIINSQFGKYGENAVAQLEQQTSSSLSRMKQMSETIYSYLLNPAHTDLRNQAPVSYSEIIEKNDFEALLKSLRTDQTAGIYIITPSGYYYGENNLDVAKLRNIPEWKTKPASYKGLYWLGFYMQNHAMSSSGDSNLPVLGLAVPIHNSNGTQNGSTILIEENAQELIHMFKLFETDTKSHLTIKASDGRIVYESASTFTKKDSDITWIRTLAVNQWTIEARLPAKAFYLSSGIIRSNTIVVAIISCLLAFGFAYLFSSRFTARIRTLKDSMQKVSFGKLDTRMPIEGRDELGSLDMSFNRMVSGVQSLVQEVEQSERLKKEAELKAFHYQINPHLLFNTLNSIQWKARLEGADDIRQMLYHLTMVLEGNLDISQELITVGRELRMIEHFLKIQEIRYGNVFSYELNCEDSLKQYLIPRMTLQPLFENIFFHGFTDGIGVIKLDVTVEKNELLLTLRDNGAGMTEEKRERLLVPDPKRRGRGGLGVQNADQKFKLHFGPQYGLTVFSTKGEGTAIVIHWPKEEERPDGYSKEN
ncbi:MULTISPECIES: sensor histidine kinase [unclassified Paenibacillus]|uniref:sensor histidine kinase n=1 Tax=unclassified Paenibacillus TaxID=185978 RepID=UPI0009A8628A|nr:MULTISPECIES: sensor histidine kinase [unclassified Paenibacillus]SLK06092.1 two-component system, sensor histidine kinase YesM [Paenibacillus sp. RU5A]SOC70399.1 two-component system, sensor histidine kinase YesM [Paenibacillus sp. RU26A]SOC72561.1 two-component system, sensor histidine kinase YesM [Paenibacillus sp. RU5M]